MPNKTVVNISFACYLFYMIMTCLSVPFPRALTWGFFIVWFGLFLTSVKIDKIKGFYALIVFLLFIFVCSIQWGITTAFGRLLTMIEICSPFLAFLMYKEDKPKIKSFFVVFLAILAINEVLAFRNLSAIAETGLRETLSSNAGYDQEVFKNGFAFVYSLSIVIPLFVYSLIHHRRWKVEGPKHTFWFYTLLLLIVVFTIFVYASMFTTALIIVIVGTILAFLYGRKRWFLKSILILGVAVLLFMSFYPVLLNAIGSDNAATTLISIRIEEIYSTLSGNIREADDMSGRSDLMLMSLNTFWENPIIGVYHKLSSFDMYRSFGIGNHSEWLDMLGLYGVFALLLFWFISGGISEQKKYTHVMLPIYLYLFIGFVNPVGSTFTNICVFMVIPFLIKYLFGEKVLPNQ